MKSNFPIDTERELIRFVLAMINAVRRVYIGNCIVYMSDCLGAALISRRESRTTGQFRPETARNPQRGGYRPPSAARHRQVPVELLQLAAH